METRRLGWTDLHLSEVGFGAWAIGGGDWRFGWGPQDDGDSIAAIRRALELGVNWIDTAAVYGLGHSEELVAEAIERCRDELIIATKCSLIWDERRETSVSLKKDSILRECEASLKRLQTDRIDLYQIHWPDDEARIEEAWEAMTLLTQAGKVRYGGVSNFSVEHMDRCEGARIASLQPPYSMMRRGIESSQMPYCAEHQIGIVAYSPMQSGLLTGRFSIRKVASNDWRRGAKEYQQPNLSVNVAFVEKLREIASGYDKTVAQLAIAWTLRLETVTSAIAGARSPAQIEETAGGAGWRISDEDLKRIDDLLAWRLEECRKAGGYVRG